MPAAGDARVRGAGFMTDEKAKRRVVDEWDEFERCPCVDGSAPQS